MSSPAVPARFPAVSGRALAAFAAVATALVAAFVVAPPAVAGFGSSGDLGTEARLGTAFREAFVGYWSSGARDLTPDLARIVDYWFEFHVVKGLVAVILLGVFAVAVVRLGKAYVGARGAGKRIALAAAGVLAAVLGVVSLTAVMANVQGVLSPFGSLFPFLLEGPAVGASADALEQAGQQLASGAGSYSPALDVLVGEYGWYHVAMVGIASVVAVVLAGTGVVAFTRARSSDRRARRVLRLFSAFAVLLSLVAVVLVVANVSVVADPAPGLAALFTGGW
jgi:hypothetical protein